MAAAGAIGGLCGLALGLPSLRLPGFYFAMATMAFALIVSELILAQVDITGGGIGLPGPAFPAPFDTPHGFYYLVAALAVLTTWLTWNVARLHVGPRPDRRSATTRSRPRRSASRCSARSSRSSSSAASPPGSPAHCSPRLQSYITPDTFVFELSLFFFVCIIIGGRGSILGPFLGTVVLTALPELVAPLAKLGNFFYGLLLLVVVLVVPEGIGRMFEVLIERVRPRVVSNVPIEPDLPRLARAIEAAP